MSDPLVLALDVGGSLVKSAMVANGQHIVGKVCIDGIRSEASAVEILNTLAAIIAGHLSKTSMER